MIKKRKVIIYYFIDCKIKNSFNFNLYYILVINLSITLAFHDE